MYIDGNYFKTSTESISHNIKSTYSSGWNGAKNRITKNGWLENEFNNTLKHLSDNAKFPLLEGTTDIYSYSQSYLIASGNNWNPRPILQSYSAYTPSLALKNRAHLLGQKAPDNVIFKVEPIDGRIPSIEDGNSWPELLTHYQPTALENNYLFLRRNPLATNFSQDTLTDNCSYSFGDLVPIPPGSAPVFAEITIKQSVIGKLVNILFKPSQLQISLNLENGTKKTYRIISGMAKSGFLISPLIESTTEFGFLYGGTKYLLDKKVKFFSISPVGGKRQWENSYEVRFNKIIVPTQSNVSKLYKFDEALEVSEDCKISDAEK